MSLNDFIELSPIPRCRHTGFAMPVSVDASHNPVARSYAYYLQRMRQGKGSFPESVISSLKLHSCDRTSCIFYSEEST